MKETGRIEYTLVLYEDGSTKATMSQNNARPEHWALAARQLGKKADDALQDAGFFERKSEKP